MKCTPVERDARFRDAEAGIARKDATFFLAYRKRRCPGKGGGRRRTTLERLERLDKGTREERKKCL